MTTRLKIGSWESLRLAARQVRNEVFVVEQGIPRVLEQDANDPVCLHVVAFDENDLPIGTGRLLPDGHIGRMAVLESARNCGVGGSLLKALMNAASGRGDSLVALNAQATAEAFYRRHGFVRVGTDFMEAGITHICMECRLVGVADESLDAIRHQV